VFKSLAINEQKTDAQKDRKHYIRKTFLLTPEKVLRKTEAFKKLAKIISNKNNNNNYCYY